MKIEVNREIFIKVLNTSCSITNGKQILPILYENLFRFSGDRLEVVSSNLENTIVTGLNYNLIDGKVDNFVADGATILKTIRLLNIENIYLDVEVDANGFGTVTFGDPNRKKKYQIPISYESNSFPKIPESKIDKQIKIKSEMLKKAIKMCSPICNPSDIRPGFQGIAIYCQNSKLFISSTNGFLIVQSAFEVDGELPSMIISKNTASIIDNFDKDSVIEISVEKSTKKIIFSDGAINVYSTLIDGVFPPVDTIVDQIDTNSSFSFNRIDILQSIKRCSIMSNKSNNALLFDFSNDDLQLSAEDIDWNKKSSEEIQILKNNGESKHLLKIDGLTTSQFLSEIESEEVIMYTKNESSPVMFTPGDLNYLSCKFILMPIRIVNK